MRQVLFVVAVSDSLIDKAAGKQQDRRDHEPNQTSLEPSKKAATFLGSGLRSFQLVRHPPFSCLEQRLIFVTGLLICLNTSLIMFSLARPHAAKNPMQFCRCFPSPFKGFHFFEQPFRAELSELGDKQSSYLRYLFY